MVNQLALKINKKSRAERGIFTFSLLLKNSFLTATISVGQPKINERSEYFLTYKCGGRKTRRGKRAPPHLFKNRAE